MPKPQKPPRSKLVVYAAMSGNLTVALVKLAAGLYTGSSAMLSEAVHSAVDTGNQILLLLGLRQAAKRATADHPFGHGLLLYFWSFIVAIMIFGLGAGVSIVQGIAKIRQPSPVTDIWVNDIVLGAAMVIEGSTLFIGLREFRRTKGRRGWFEALQHSKDPSIFTVVLEDSAALVGLVIAAVGLGVAQAFDLPVFDGIASILVGVLLGVAAWFLAQECHGLLTGEAVAPEVSASIRKLASVDGVRHVNDAASMHFGPDDVLLALSLEFEATLSAGQVQDLVTSIEAAIQAAHPEVTRIFIEAQRKREHERTIEPTQLVAPTPLTDVA